MEERRRAAKKRQQDTWRREEQQRRQAAMEKRQQQQQLRERAQARRRQLKDEERQQEEEERQRRQVAEAERWKSQMEEQRRRQAALDRRIQEQEEQEQREQAAADRREWQEAMTHAAQEGGGDVGRDEQMTEAKNPQTQPVRQDEAKTDANAPAAEANVPPGPKLTGVRTRFCLCQRRGRCTGGTVPVETARCWCIQLVVGATVALPRAVDQPPPLWRNPPEIEQLWRSRVKNTSGAKVGHTSPSLALRLWPLCTMVAFARTVSAAPGGVAEAGWKRQGLVWRQTVTTHAHTRTQHSCTSPWRPPCAGGIGGGGLDSSGCRGNEGHESCQAALPCW